MKKELNKKEGGISVIAIDDDSVILDLCKSMLEKEFDVTVLVTTDSTVALSSAFENPPDLFITDLGHPGINGVSLVRRLRGKESTRSVPILYCISRSRN